jgi:hypothetical protein
VLVFNPSLVPGTGNIFQQLLYQILLPLQNPFFRMENCTSYRMASIADLFTLLSSSVQNSEGGGNGDGGDSFADPCQEFKQGFLRVSSGLPLV